MEDLVEYVCTIKGTLLDFVMGKAGVVATSSAGSPAIPPHQVNDLVRTATYHNEQLSVEVCKGAVTLSHDSGNAIGLTPNQAVSLKKIFELEIA